jgi:branched-chain amino acid transport system permease protein
MHTTALPAASTPALQLGDALKDALFAGILAALLALPLLGLTTSTTAQHSEIIARWPWVGIAVAGVMIGRLLLSLWEQRQAGRRGISGGKRSFAIIFAGAYRRNAVPVAVVMVLLAAGLPFYASRTWIDLATLVLIYLTLAWGLSIVVGLAGLLDLGYVAFYAIGAYTFALLSQHWGLGFWQCLPLAGLVAAAFGIALAFPILRLRGDYLAIVTLAFAQIIQTVLSNWASLTGGPNGISQIARPTFFGLEFARRAPEGGTTFHQFFGLPFDSEYRLIFMFYLVLAMALLVNLFSLRIRKLPLGRAWEAMREDEIACRALGINLPKTKLSAYAIGATIAGIAGCLFAAKQGFISPDSFSFMETAIILAIVVLGGMGSQMGILVAALFLVLLPELSREFADFRMLIFGLAMVLVMICKPGGLVSARQPTIRLAGKGM